MFRSNPEKHAVKQRNWVIFEINAKDPYRCYSATPLLTCFGLMMQFTDAKGQSKVMLYHIMSGLTDTRILDQIRIQMGEDITVNQVVLAVPDYKGFKETERLIDILKEEAINIFGKDVDKVVYNTSIYEADNRGNHGMIVVRNSLTDKPDELRTTLKK